MKLIFGTRSSTLARTQTEVVAEILRELGHDVELMEIVTTGDTDQERTVPEIGAQGVFTAELEEALLAGTVDAAVHSYKDMPTAGTKGLKVAAVTERVDPRDALVSRGSVGLDDLPKGAVVGTASLRRRAMILRRRPDLDVAALRGNVDTRMSKVRDGELDAIVVAAAGLVRLGRSDEISEYLDFLPAPAQGALAIQCASSRPDVAEALLHLHDPSTHDCVLAERVLLADLEGGCSVPLGALAVLEDGRVKLAATVVSTDGQKVFEAEGEGTDPNAVGTEVARKLRELGAEPYLRG